MKNIVVLLTFLLANCTSLSAIDGSAPPKAKADSAEHHAENEPRPYDKEADAELDINQTLLAAKEEEKLGLLIFGANWCHDSRALAAHFEKPRFQSLLRSHYKMTYVDVGQKNRNIDLARKFGVDDIVGTPTVFVTNPNGDVLNSDTAPTWRNAASRDENSVFEYFREFAHPKP